MYSVAFHTTHNIYRPLKTDLQLLQLKKELLTLEIFVQIESSLQSPNIVSQEIILASV